MRPNRRDRRLRRAIHRTLNTSVRTYSIVLAVSEGAEVRPHASDDRQPAVEVRGRHLDRFTVALRTLDALFRRTPPNPPLRKGVRREADRPVSFPPLAKGGEFAAPVGVRHSTVTRSRAPHG